MFSQEIIWKNQTQLSWADYLAAKPQGQTLHALTASGVNFDMSFEQANNTITVYLMVNAIFSAAESWSDPEHETTSLLAHEQLHFDITELNARKLRKSLLEYSYTKNYESEIEHLFREYSEERAGMQKEYDMATNHSNNRDKQTEWQQIVHQKLEELKEYAKPDLKITIDIQ